LHLHPNPLFGPLLVLTTSTMKCWLFCMDILIYLHQILISTKWEIMSFLGSLGWTKNGQVFKEFSIQLMKFTFKIEIFQKLCWYLINLNTSWIPCRKNIKLIFLHFVFIYKNFHILNLGVKIHIIYINPFESFILNLTMNMHGQYFVITLKKTKDANHWPITMAN